METYLLRSLHRATGCRRARTISQKWFRKALPEPAITALSAAIPQPFPQSKWRFFIEFSRGGGRLFRGVWMFLIRVQAYFFFLFFPHVVLLIFVPRIFFVRY